MRRQSTIITGLLTALMLAALVGCGAATGSGRASGTATSAPVAPTSTPTPPTPTPTALEQRLDAIVQPAIGTLAHNVFVTFDPTKDAATITATVDRGPNEPVPVTQEHVKTVCFQALRALWTAGETVKDVDVGVLGLVQDDFGNHILAAYGSADVTAPTAATLHWASLTPDTAWNAYTYVFLAPSYAAGQYWGLPTPTPYPTVRMPQPATVV
jgi:hypothetical protein